jgi:pyruvate dehydrogenase E1 component
MKYQQTAASSTPRTARSGAFLGDGEMDEPESLGAISLAGRERLDNLIFVVNCNLQRLDGPVRGNGKIIQELEGVFRGAGWNVIKVIWGSKWDPLLERDESRACCRSAWTRSATATTELQVQGRRLHPRALLRQVSGARWSWSPTCPTRTSGAQPRRPRPLSRSTRPTRGHARQASPTVILAKTVKGYGMGEAGEGHEHHPLAEEDGREALKAFRDRFNIPISDDKICRGPYYKPPTRQPGDALHARAPRGLGGFAAGAREAQPLPVPGLDAFKRAAEGQRRARDVHHHGLRAHADHPRQATRPSASAWCPSCPTRRAPSAWRACSASSASTPPSASSTRRWTPTRSCTTGGQERPDPAGGHQRGRRHVAWIAAATAYSNHGYPMMPFYIYYSMFGFQRIGDLPGPPATCRRAAS